MQIVWGGDEMPSGANPIGNSCLVIVSKEIFKKGCSRPFPAVLWNGPEEWAVEVYEAIMRDEWKMSINLQIHVNMPDSPNFSLRGIVRMLSTDNKLNATFYGQMKGSANNRAWMLGRASDGFGLHIKNADDLSQYKGSTLRSKTNEYSDVLHRAAEEILISLSKGKYHNMEGKDLKAALKAKAAAVAAVAVSASSPAESNMLDLRVSGKNAELIDRLHAFDPPQKATLADLKQVVLGRPAKDLLAICQPHKSRQGMEWYPIGLADNPRALHDALAYVREKHGRGEASAEYFYILLLLDRRVCKHSLLNRCAPEALPALLNAPDPGSAAKGFSLDRGPQGALAIFHTLKFIDRLCIYKLILFNRNPGFRLSAEAIAEIDGMVLAGYRTTANPMKSHLNFIYGHHVEAIFRQVETIFAKAPESMKCVARLISMAHVHFGHLHMRDLDESAKDIFHSDACTNDCVQLAAYHGLAFTLPLVGQLLGNWRVDNLYWIGFRWAAFMQQELATDPNLSPIDLQSASDYTVEQFHQLVKRVLRGTRCGLDDLERVDRHRFQAFMDEIAFGAGRQAVHKQTEAYLNGVMACACVVRGCATATEEQEQVEASVERDAQAVHANRLVQHIIVEDELHRDGLQDLEAMEQEEQEEEVSQEEARRVAEEAELDDAVAGEGEHGRTKHGQVLVNLGVHSDSVKKLSARVGTSLQWTHAHHVIWGQPAVSAICLSELITAGGMRWFNAIAAQRPDTFSWPESTLKTGEYAIVVTKELATVDDWSDYVLIVVDGSRIATVQTRTARPANTQQVLRITVHPLAWVKLQSMEPSDAADGVNCAMASKQVWTEGKALCVTCICDLRPCILCCNCGFTDSVELDGQEFDIPLPRGETPWKKQKNADAVFAMKKALKHTVAAWEACLSTVVDSEVEFDSEFCTVHVRKELVRLWGCEPNVDMYIPIKETEDRMGAVTTAWLHLELAKHAVVGMSGRQRGFLVSALREARKVALAAADQQHAATSPQPARLLPAIPCVALSATAALPLAADESDPDLDDPATTVAAFVNDQDKLKYKKIDHDCSTESHINLKVLKAYGQPTCELAGEAGTQGRGRSYVEAWTRHLRRFDELSVLRTDVLFGLRARRRAILPGDPARPWTVPGAVQRQAEVKLAQLFGDQ